MKKLNFSGISTEILTDLVINDKACFRINCKGIICSHCPQYYTMHEITDEEIYPQLVNQYKEELERREKDMNTMPELKAGMIVEWIYDGGTLRSLYITSEWCLNIDRDTWTSTLQDKHIVAIYKGSRGSFDDISDGMTLIWSRKSDKDLKIEELQEKMDAISKEMEELKG
ncbi:MAG: hypothetical protein GY928_21400 [Colwellia sp.]|nr:hypothetical protein [Colwellia sp.]